MEFDPALHTLIATHLRQFAVESAAPAGHRQAAVALAVVHEGTGAALPGLPSPVQWSTRAALVLTRRHAALGSHAGQWALPGGRIDAGQAGRDLARRRGSIVLLRTLAVNGRVQRDHADHRQTAQDIGHRNPVSTEARPSLNPSGA